MNSAVRGLLYALVFAMLNGCATAVMTGAGREGYQTDDGRSTDQFRADAAITAAVNRALVRSREVPAMSIRVRTYHGRVTLGGQVPDRATAERAVRIAAGVPGVASVRNELAIGGR